MDTHSKQPVPIVFWILLVSVLIVLGQSLYVQTIEKDYPFFVEASCDPTTNECYSRSCDDDSCPPDNLTEYRVFKLPASQFKNCTDNSCLNICPSAAASCEEILCSTQSDVSCEGPVATASGS